MVASNAGVLPSRKFVSDNLVPPYGGASLAALKDQLKIEHDDEDSHIQFLLDSAAEQIEQWINRPIKSRKTIAYYDNSIRAKTIIIDGGVEGYDPASDTEFKPDEDKFSAVAFDEDGIEIELDGFTAIAAGSDFLQLKVVGDFPPAAIHDGLFMRVSYMPNAILNTTIAHAILMIAAGAYENRESEGIMQVKNNPAISRMLMPYKRPLAWRAFRNASRKP